MAEIRASKEEEAVLISDDSQQHRDQQEAPHGEDSTQRSSSRRIESSPVLLGRTAHRTATPASIVLGEERPWETDSGSKKGTAPVGFVSPLGETQYYLPTSTIPETVSSSPGCHAERRPSPILETVERGSNDTSASPSHMRNSTKRRYDELDQEQQEEQREEEERDEHRESRTDEAGESQQTEKSFVSTLSMNHSAERRDAYYHMLERGGLPDWDREGISLLSTDGHHFNKEREL